MKKNLGFTLIETLVAIAVLMIAITIPYYSVEKALVATYVARDQLTAASLAAEGLEYVRGVRDSNYIYNVDTNGNASWMANLDSPVQEAAQIYGAADCFSHACTIDTTTYKAEQCSTPDCTDMPLYITNESDDKFYTQDTGDGNTVSKFSRAIRLTQINSTEILASSTVTWSTNGSGPAHTYKVQVTEYFDNWLQ